MMGGELTMAPPAELWRHSCHPLRAPLLKRLAAVSEQVVQEVNGNLNQIKICYLKILELKIKFKQTKICLFKNFRFI
jgi:hypothetical protein